MQGGGFNRGPPMGGRGMPMRGGRGGRGGFAPRGGAPPVARRGGGGGGFRPRGGGGPPPARRGGFGGPPPQNNFRAAPGGGGGFPGGGGGGPPPAQRGGFGGPPPVAQRGGFGGPPPAQRGGFGAPASGFNPVSPRGGGGFGGGGGNGNDRWLHQTVTGDMAMDVLENRPVGTYLFRPSATPGFLTLSFKKENGEVYHVRITQNAEGFLNDGDPRTFPTLEALAKSKPRTLKTPILVGDL